MWFVTVLGPVPPARQTQGWTGPAAQVMAYRLTSQITDDVVALGPAPVDNGSPVRAEWHYLVAPGVRQAMAVQEVGERHAQ